MLCTWFWKYCKKEETISWEIFSSDFHNLLQWSLSFSTMNVSVFNDNICPWIMRFFHKSSDILTWPINFEKINHFLMFLTSNVKIHNWDNLFQNIFKYNKWNMIQCKLVVSIKKWVDINEYKYVCIKLVHTWWENWQYAICPKETSIVAIFWIWKTNKQTHNSWTKFGNSGNSV